MDTDEAGPPVAEQSAPDVESWYRRDAGRIERYARRAGAGQEDAEDISQETFTRALSKGPVETTEAAEAPGRAWLHAVAGNLVRDGWRRQESATRRKARLLAGERLNAVPRPDDLALASWEASLVRQALGRLPADSRQVLLMRIVEGRTADEVSKIIGRTPDVVRQIQHRALLRVRNELLAMGWDRTSSSALGGTTR